MTFSHTDQIHEELRERFEIDDFGDPDLVDEVKKDLDEYDAAEVDELVHALSIMGRDSDLIAVEDFEDYAQQLAEDVGAISRDGGWPVNCIDWERAALDLAQDYGLIHIGGTNYYYRES